MIRRGGVVVMVVLVAVGAALLLTDNDPADDAGVSSDPSREPQFDASGNEIPTDEAGRIIPGTLPLPGAPSYGSTPRELDGHYEDFVAVYLEEDRTSIGFVDSTYLRPEQDGQAPVTDRVVLPAYDLDGEQVGTFIVNG